MMIEYNGADPKSVAWARQEMQNQRAMRVSLGYDAICSNCGQQGPRAWMVDGRCGPDLLETRACEPVDVRLKRMEATDRMHTRIENVCFGILAVTITITALAILYAI